MSVKIYAMEKAAPGWHTFSVELPDGTTIADVSIVRQGDVFDFTNPARDKVPADYRDEVLAAAFDAIAERSR